MTTPAPQIVVGVDGSHSSRLALDWALEEADARKLPITVVSSWHQPYAASGFGYGYVLADVGDAAEKNAQHVAETELHAALERRTSTAPLSTRAAAVEGPAAASLVELSRTAAQLVVGSRGNGGFERLALGSVSSACVHHAHCPVTVVRGDHEVTP